MVYARHYRRRVHHHGLDGHSAAAGADTAQFSLGVASMQSVFSVPWIKSFNIYYFMGIDGISFPLVLLTAFVCMLAMAHELEHRQAR